MSKNDCCGGCERVVITKQGERGYPGPAGPKGANGVNGAVGPQGEQGAAGEPGGSALLAGYNDLTGIGNTSPIDETVLFTHVVPANTLFSAGDELEVYVYIDYTDNDQVDLAFKLSATEKYTESIQNAISDSRIIKIKISRIDQNNQLWVIESLIADATSNRVQTINRVATTFDLSTASTFEITASNVALGANQVSMKKASLYRHNI